MKNKITLFLAFLSTIVIVIPACEKEGDPPAAKTKTELMTQSSWKFEKATALGSDISAHPSLACYIDNTIKFEANLSGTGTEGASACSTPIPSTFTWSFQNSESILRLSFILFSGGSSDFTIVSLTETNLVVSQTITVGTTPTPVEVTFKH